MSYLYKDELPDRFTDIMEMSTSKKEIIFESKKSKTYNSGSTKSASYNTLDINKLDRAVYDVILQCGSCTRQEIAKLLMKELCTISGCVTRLLDQEWIKVSGRVLNESSGREVESLTINKKVGV